MCSADTLSAIAVQLAGMSNIEVVSDGKMVIHRMSLHANVTSGNVVVGCAPLRLHTWYKS